MLLRVLNLFNIFASIVFNLSILLNFPLEMLGINTIPIEYELFFGTVLASLSILSYLILIIFDRKNAFKKYRIAISILPFLYVLATFSDMHSQNLSLFDIFSLKQPVLYRLH